MQKMEALFGPSFTTEVPGTGTGVAALRGGAEDHRGSGEVRSEPGETEASMAVRTERGGMARVPEGNVVKPG